MSFQPYYYVFKKIIYIELLGIKSEQKALFLFI